MQEYHRLYTKRGLRKFAILAELPSFDIALIDYFAPSDRVFGTPKQSTLLVEFSATPRENCLTLLSEYPIPDKFPIVQALKFNSRGHVTSLCLYAYKGEEEKMVANASFPSIKPKHQVRRSESPAIFPYFASAYGVEETRESKPLFKPTTEVDGFLAPVRRKVLAVTKAMSYQGKGNGASLLHQILRATYGPGFEGYLRSASNVVSQFSANVSERGIVAAVSARASAAIS